MGMLIRLSLLKTSANDNWHCIPRRNQHLEAHWYGDDAR